MTRIEQIFAVNIFISFRTSGAKCTADIFVSNQRLGTRLVLKIFNL